MAGLSEAEKLNGIVTGVTGHYLAKYVTICRNNDADPEQQRKLADILLHPDFFIEDGLEYIDRNGKILKLTKDEVRTEYIIGQVMHGMGSSWAIICNGNSNNNDYEFASDCFNLEEEKFHENDTAAKSQK